MVARPGAMAVTTPAASTVATDGDSDFQVTSTPSRGMPSLVKVRGLEPRRRSGHQRRGQRRDGHRGHLLRLDADVAQPGLAVDDGADLQLAGREDA